MPRLSGSRSGAPACDRSARSSSASATCTGSGGAKATGGGGRYEVSPMEIFTGRTTIVIFGNEKSLIKTAARELREVHQAQAAPRLLRPARGSLKERLPCQRKRR